MADIIDQANDTADTFLSASLRNRQQQAKIASPAATGECLHCHEELPDERRWCDAECRDAWEFMKKRSSL